tara:strand:- start:285 stop:461 length:177 start_codon:yes stop_codon:yes gene_type:complete
LKSCGEENVGRGLSPSVRKFTLNLGPSEGPYLGALKGPGAMRALFTLIKKSIFKKENI